jgi:hypothetical protein
MKTDFHSPYPKLYPNPYPYPYPTEPEPNNPAPLYIVLLVLLFSLLSGLTHSQTGSRYADLFFQHSHICKKEANPINLISTPIKN